MSGAVGSNIAAVDYTSIRAKVIALLGTGSIDKGYGQTVNSATVVTGNTITKDQWDALRYDLMSIKFHQDGVMPSIVQVSKNDPIRYGAGNPNTDYDFIATQATLNRFNVGPGQFVVSTKGMQEYNSNWSVSATAVLTATFSNANQARYFFNSGGKIRFTSSRTGGTTKPQNNAWTSILSSAATQSFDADSTKLLSFYSLTDQYQSFYQIASSSPYSSSYYKLEAKCDVPSNANGTATVVTFRVTWNDGYTDPDLSQNPGSFPLSNPPDDVVDGTLAITVEELKATGQLFPSGTFSITSPVYSLSSIVAS